MDFEQADNLLFDGWAWQSKSICIIDGAFDVYQSADLAEEHNLNVCSPVSGGYQVRIGVIEPPRRAYRDLYCRD